MATTLLAQCGRVGAAFYSRLGVFSQTGYLFLVTLLFGGDASAIAPLLVLTLKVATVLAGLGHRLFRSGSRTSSPMA